jgi:hypothetical protein
MVKPDRAARRPFPDRMSRFLLSLRWVGSFSNRSAGIGFRTIRTFVKVTLIGKSILKLPEFSVANEILTVFGRVNSAAAPTPERNMGKG